jgi:F-type H+-transporting ATPase subunit beta
MNTGKVVQVYGQVVDVEFTPQHLPAIYTALKVSEKYSTGGQEKSLELTLEVMQHLGGNIVRTLVMGATEGLSRGMIVADTGKPISVPVGKGCLGRLMNYAGEPIDYKGEIPAQEYHSIHRNPPTLLEQDTKMEILETGIKVIDLLAPFRKGGDRKSVV